MGYINLSCECVRIRKMKKEKETDDAHVPDAPLQVRVHYQPYHGSKEQALGTERVLGMVQVPRMEWEVLERVRVDNSHGWELGMGLEIQGNWVRTWEGEQEGHDEPVQREHGQHMGYGGASGHADGIHGKMAMYFFILLPFYKV